MKSIVKTPREKDKRSHVEIITPNFQTHHKMVNPPLFPTAV